MAYALDHHGNLALQLPDGSFLYPDENGNYSVDEDTYYQQFAPPPTLATLLPQIANTVAQGQSFRLFCEDGNQCDTAIYRGGAFYLGSSGALIDTTGGRVGGSIQFKNTLLYLPAGQGFIDLRTQAQHDSDFQEYLRSTQPSFIDKVANVGFGVVAGVILNAAGAAAVGAIADSAAGGVAPDVSAASGGVDFPDPSAPSFSDPGVVDSSSAISPVEAAPSSSALGSLVTPKSIVGAVQTLVSLKAPAAKPQPVAPPRAPAGPSPTSSAPACNVCGLARGLLAIAPLAALAFG